MDRINDQDLFPVDTAVYTSYNTLSELKGEYNLCASFI